MKEITISEYLGLIKTTAHVIASKTNIKGAVSLERLPYHTGGLVIKPTIISGVSLDVGDIVFKLMRDKTKDYKESTIPMPYTREVSDLVKFSIVDGEMVSEEIFNVTPQELNNVQQMVVRASTVYSPNLYKLISEGDFNYLFTAIQPIEYCGELLIRDDVKATFKMGFNLTILVEMKIYNNSKLCWEVFSEQKVPTVGRGFISDISAVLVKAWSTNESKYALWKEDNNFINSAERLLEKVTLHDIEGFSLELFRTIESYYYKKGAVSPKFTLALVTLYVRQKDLVLLNNLYKSSIDLGRTLNNLMPPKMTGFKKYKKKNVAITDLKLIQEGYKSTSRRFQN